MFNNINDKIDYFNKLQKRLLEQSDLSIKEIEILNNLAQEFIDITKHTYDNIASKYSSERTMQINSRDQVIWEELFYMIEHILHKNLNEICMLDVGTGSGRDIKYASSKGINIIGIDNSDGFISILKELEKENIIPKNSFLQASMLELPFDNETFDLVRQNASLLHIPLTTPGNMLDKVIAENHRVLKSNGLLHIYIKEGNGVQYIDTNEGLGGRIFQMHSKESISKVLSRNNFNIIKIEQLQEERNGNIIKFINIIAQKTT